MILKKKKKLNIPKFPRLIIDTLKSKGFDAYIVGGCVRDQLLGLKPSDFDITTNAKPEDIKKLFKKTIDTGIKHGTVSVLFYENNVPHVYEVTTYRVDGRYSDGRHPENVTFVDDLREDLRRRDFTVNAMAYNDDIGLVDEFDGLSDLNNKICLRIKFERVKRNWSQEQLADFADLNRNTIGNIERGLASPTEDTLEKLATAFSISVLDLMDVSNITL